VKARSGPLTEVATLDLIRASAIDYLISPRAAHARHAHSLRLFAESAIQYQVAQLNTRTRFDVRRLAPT